MLTAMTRSPSELTYTLTEVVDECDPRYGMTNYTIVWPGGWTTDCVTRDRVTAVRWAEREIAGAGFVPRDSAVA
jgi:hypothetical protein